MVGNLRAGGTDLANPPTTDRGNIIIGLANRHTIGPESSHSNTEKERFIDPGTILDPVIIIRDQVTPLEAGNMTRDVIKIMIAVLTLVITVTEMNILILTVYMTVGRHKNGITVHPCRAVKDTETVHLYLTTEDRYPRPQFLSSVNLLHLSTPATNLSLIL